MVRLKGIRSKIDVDKILGSELTQKKELLVDITAKKMATFTLWVQGFQSAEMATRERLLNNLLGAGLVELELKYTHHNAYIKAWVTERGAELTRSLAGVPTGL